MDIRELLEKMDDFAGQEVGQKPGDQVRGTERAKTGGKQHPFKGRLVGGSCEESVLPELDKASKERNVHREIAESWAKFQENMDDPAAAHAKAKEKLAPIKPMEGYNINGVDAQHERELKAHHKAELKKKADAGDENAKKRLQALHDREQARRDEFNARMERESIEQGGAGGQTQQLNVQQLATISDAALDNAYHYGRSQPGNSFGWQANLASAAYAKQMIDRGETDVEAISDAVHKGWWSVAQKFVDNPDQFSDTEKLRANGKFDIKMADRKAQMVPFNQLTKDQQDIDTVVARAMLQAIKGQQGVAEELTPTANTTTAQTTGTTTPAAGATTATPQDAAKSQQQQALAKRNLGALKTAGVDIDPAKAMPALQKAGTGAPMDTNDQAAIAKMAPALGKILQGPQGQQLANLVKSAGAMK